MSFEPLGLLMDCLRQLCQERVSGLIYDGMNGIKPQSINVTFSDPIECVFDEITSDFVAAGSVKIEGHAPGGAIPVREIGSKISEVVSLRPQMVVDNIQNNGQSFPMARINESLQPIGPPVCILNRKRVSPVVAPVAASRKLPRRHKFNGSYAKLRKFVQMTGHGIESPLRCKGAGVELIDHVIPQILTGPGSVFPRKTGIDHPGRAVNALRLEPRSRIRSAPVTVYREEVEGSGLHFIENAMEVASLLFCQSQPPLTRRNDLHVDCIRGGRPHQKLAPRVLLKRGPEVDGSVHYGPHNSKVKSCSH